MAIEFNGGVVVVRRYGRMEITGWVRPEVWLAYLAERGIGSDTQL